MKSLATILIITALSAGVNKSSFAVPVSVSVAGDRTEIQDRHLSGFSSIDVSGSFDVFITQGSTESVKVEAERGDLDKIVTEVKNGVLHIDNKRSMGGMSWDWGNRKRIVRVVVRNVNAVNVNGSGDVAFSEGLRTQSLSLMVRGSGDVEGRIEAENLECGISGSGDVALSGRADNISVKASGSGDFDARKLQSVNAAVKLSGSGDAVVNASQRVDAKVSGSGDIRYTGAAKQVSTSKSGSGDIGRL
ncbi:head GIN domain-containing protein [Mucilaginibacter sp. CSA2-8R]|uniref:head GIN domain-containing protein n=1 Tax=Mucilaginibacter sp. CSA2-8R TaxID=3141542 RepID=UPI00315C74C4